MANAGSTYYMEESVANFFKNTFIVYNEKGAHDRMYLKGEITSDNAERLTKKGNLVKIFGNYFGNMVKTDVYMSDNAKGTLSSERLRALAYNGKNSLSEAIGRGSVDILKLDELRSSMKDYVILLSDKTFQKMAVDSGAGSEFSAYKVPKYITEKGIKMVRGSDVYKAVCTKGASIFTKILAKLGLTKFSQLADNSKILNKGRSEEGKSFGAKSVNALNIKNIDKDMDKIVKDINGYMTGGKFSLQGYANKIENCINEIVEKHAERVKLAEAADIKLTPKTVPGYLVKIPEVKFGDDVISRDDIYIAGAD